VKQQKSKAYFKRFQVKYRRRREGKTDYRARKRLVCQDKNKYNSPKYRFVVRISNTKVMTQIVYAELDGDKVLCAANSTELPRYGLKVGLKNYAAAYCTGLLCARRLLTKLGLAEAYEGNEEVDAEVQTSEMNGRKYYVAELDDEKRPFRALLDVGIRPTTTGHRVFGALKGAADGGLDIPHTEKRFPGYDRDCKEYDSEVHRERIFGEHIAEYMRKLLDEDQTKYNTQFAEYIKNNAGPEELEDLYTSVHAAIREDPSPAAKTTGTYDKKFKNTARLTYDERKAAVAAKKAAHAAALAAAEEEGEAEEEDGADY
jgi:large subunit ribosomal protein L5e